MLITPIFAYSNNNQKVYNLESDIYEAISQLYIMTGHALPSTTGPYSEAELINMVNEINYNSLPIYGKTIYEYVDKELNKSPIDPRGQIGIKVGIDVNVEVYAHTNTTNTEFQTKYNWGYDINDQKPNGKFSLETWPGNSFYGYFELILGNSFMTNDVGEFGTKNFHTNIFSFQNFELPKDPLMNSGHHIGLLLLLVENYGHFK